MSGFNMPPGVSPSGIPGNDDDWCEEGESQAMAVCTLRDWFAAAALPALISAMCSGQHTTPRIASTPQEGIAIDAYMLADAMLKARKK